MSKQKEKQTYFQDRWLSVDDYSSSQMKGNHLAALIFIYILTHKKRLVFEKVTWPN